MTVFFASLKYLVHYTLTQIGITFWDERLSTSAVERLLTKEADLSRNRRSEIIDKMAAAYILQGALDSLSP